MINCSLVFTLIEGTMMCRCI